MNRFRFAQNAARMGAPGSAPGCVPGGMPGCTPGSALGGKLESASRCAPGCKPAPFPLSVRVGHAARVALAALFALALAAALFAPAAAFADDDGGDDANLVNPQQRPDSSFIYDSSISDLSSADSYYDKQTVQVTGEAVGDEIDAGSGMVWIALADESDANATISVLMTRESASHIDEFGRYGVTGTTLQVRGQFNLACSEHEGLSDLHAQSVVVAKKGTEHADALRLEAFIPGAVLVGVGLALMLLFRHLREKLR